MLVKKFTQILLLTTLVLLIPLLTSAYSADHIVIHKIQIAGETSKDEFIELHNPTSSSISLEGWRLSKKTKSGNEYNILTTLPTISIPAGGYLVIAHTNYSSTANLFYSTSQSLASDNTLILYSDAGDTIVDLVGWGEGAIFEGSGSAPNPNSREILTRNEDTNDNQNDFQISNNQNNNISNEPETTKDNEEDKEKNINRPNNPAELIPETDDENTSTSSSNSNDSQNKSDYKTFGNVVITELLPNPEGSDQAGEWIEIKNSDPYPIDISDWILTDGSKSYVFSPGTIINPEQILLIKRDESKLALNNTNPEHISILDSKRFTINQVSYFDKAPEGLSWARIDGKWQWSQSPTPGYDNNFLYATKTNNQKNTLTVKPDGNENKNLKQTIDDERLEISSQDYSSLIISELLPNPEGSDEENEWIELYNKGNTTLNLSGIKIGDSTKIYELSDLSIDSKNYLLIRRTDSKIALNNNGDEVKLWDPQGSLIIQTRYFTGAEEGMSYALQDNNLWDWSQNPTPGQSNTFPKTQESEKKPVSNKPAFLNGQIPIDEIRDFQIGTQVTASGQVAALPGTLAKTYFYIADATSGIKIYSSKKLFPENLQIGDLIQVSGKLSESQDEYRISVSSSDGIQILENKTDDLEPQKINTAEIDEPLEGSFIQITGEVVENKSSSLYIADSLGEVRVYIANGTDIDPKTWRQGDHVEVTGILSQTKSGYRILPRHEADIILTSPETQVAGASDKQIFIANKSKSSNPTKYIVVLIIILLTITFLFLNSKFHWLKLSNQNKNDSDSFKE